MREGAACAGSSFCSVVVFPVCVQEIWCQIVRLLIRQCNEVVFSVGEGTGGAGAGHQEGAVPQRQEEALGIKRGLFPNGRRRGGMGGGLQICMPAASLSSHRAVGLGLNGETETSTRMLTAGLHIVVVIRGGSLSLSTPC